ncbi:hypothetical protein NLG97_g7829 [Lecanicillium saksenae]|uniref:Uncharacterized protein n=1 Tax=Lecanicillium saksenae TaxID=468837 RepID=A0ACC1QMJ2_9HYPO|nr:hypothetical protein NLG97_g7829 [Lecanicillium saksenae]
MTLCGVCGAIPFADLPPFPQDNHGTDLTGQEYIHPLRRHSDFSRNPETSRVRHHTNVEHLSEAASAGYALDERSKQVYQRSYQPTVQMWLVKRPGGGQGFWVLSESIQSKDEKHLVPIAAFNFSVSEDDALADTIDTRPLLESPEIYGLQQLRKWSLECEQNHECYQHSAANPRYLIDVGSSESGNSIEHVQPDTQKLIKYTALSYSPSGDIESQRKLVDQLKDGSASFEQLPKLFQDAISVTRTLGVQYIWIDALCTPDSSEELKRDSREFASVYENAFLTISATGAQSMKEGLLFPRAPRDAIRLPYHASGHSVSGSVNASILPLKKEILRSACFRDESSTLPDQMYFECLNHVRAEDGLCQGERYHTTIDKLRGGPDWYREQTVMGRWYRMVCDYGQRTVATPREKLFGMANIARAFRHLLDDEYIAGLWRNSLIEGLCWRPHNCTPLSGTTAPSWSWACVDGSVMAGFREDSIRPEASISEIRVNLEDEGSPFGNVTSAAIIMEAPMIPLRLVEKDYEEDWHLFLCTESGDEAGFNPGLNTMDPRYSVSAETIRNSTLFALVLAETRREKCTTKSCRAPVLLRGLVVSPVDASGDTVRRVGCFVTGPETFEQDLSKSRKSITLI